MKKIQFITYSEGKYSNYNKDFQISNLNNLKALDNYDINVIDLSSENIWRNREHNQSVPTERTVVTSDFRSIQAMINNSQKNITIICLPQNINYYCKFYSANHYYQLKDMIPVFTKILEQLIPFIGVGLTYENNITQIANREIESSFYFNEMSFSNLTRSKDSNKVTTIKHKNIILTTLNLIDKQNSNILLDFLSEIGLNEEQTNLPKWLYDYEFYDDRMLKEDINKAMQEIEKQNDIIKNAEEKIQKNMHFKSILVTQSNELVSVVFEILENIFGVSLEDFKDEKKEDFLIKKDNITYIGEIKGVTSNVRYENISQLDVHYSKYMDKLQDEGRTEKIKKLLIMNYERNKEIDQRNNINQMQIDLAVKNNTLIIDTKNLLMIYDKILQGTLRKEDVVSYFTEKSGIVELDKI